MICTNSSIKQLRCTVGIYPNLLYTVIRFNNVGAEVFLMEELNELDSTCGVSDEELTKRFKEAVRIDNEIKKIKGLPIAKYDMEKKAPYLEYPDGRREYA